MNEQRCRPRIQAEYGVPSSRRGMLAWQEIVDRLLRAEIYWIVTLDPDGSPQTTPVWGTWFDGAVWFSCGDETSKARNLGRNPRVTIHLDSEHGVVIVHGEARRLDDPAREARVTAVLRAKYGESEIPDTAAALRGSYYEVRPARVLAWAEFPRDVTRFVFPRP